MRFRCINISMVLLLLVQISAVADSFCGVVLAQQGLTVRLTPSPDGTVLYQLPQGGTFKFYTDGYTGIEHTMDDGKVKSTGQWIKIELNSDSVEAEEGYLFLGEGYSVEFYDCRAYRNRISPEALYQPLDYGQETTGQVQRIKKRVDLSIYDGVLPSTESTAIFTKDNRDFQVAGDTLFLKLADGSQKAIVSYPMGEDGNDENLIVFEYVGYVADLNAYLLQMSLWESGQHVLVSKKTGKLSEGFLDMPVLGENGMFATCSEPDGAFGADMAIYRYKDGVLTQLLSYGFGQWAFDGEMHWLSENELLIAARSLEDRDNYVDDEYDDNAEEIALRKRVRKQYVRLRLR